MFQKNVPGFVHGKMITNKPSQSPLSQKAGTCIFTPQYLACDNSRAFSMLAVFAAERY